MSNNTHSSLKNGAVSHHTPDDAVYLKPLRLSCNLCRNSGQSKIRKNLWQLHTHFLYHHREEPFQEIESMIIKLIKESVLR